MSGYGLLKEKVCLITGTSRGIGQAIAEAFAAEGGIVYANVRKQGSASNWQGDGGGTIIPLCFDVTDSAAAKDAIMRIRKEHGKLDVLVNNAGVMKDALIGMIDRKTMTDTFAVNVFAVIEMLQLAAKLMTRQRSGSIINLASLVGVNGNKGQMVYSASKGAVISLTKTAAKELAPLNIRVNAVAPGMINTDMFRSVGDEHVRERIDLIGMNRLGEPEDVAKACLFLASDLSEYITGQILGVDGSALI